MRDKLRILATLTAIVWMVGLSTAQDDAKKKPPERFGFAVDDVVYPQKTPAEAMKSVVTAYDRKRVDYMLAHLIDSAYVDYWIIEYSHDIKAGKEEGRRLLAFERLTGATNLYYQNDPLIVKDLRVFAREAKWTDEGDVAIGTVEAIPARKVFMKKIGERWFLENRQQ
jgi:hypothetical protein